MAQTVIGMFNTHAKAKTAVRELETAGIDRNKIDLGGKAEDHNKSHDEGILSSFFGSLFDDHDDANRYSTAARDNVVVTVHTHNMEDAKRAAAILNQHGALGAEEKVSPLTGKHEAHGTADATKSVPVVEEEMKVGKREVASGGVRVHSRIVEKPVEEHLRLRVEHVHVERNPVDRAATEADLGAFKEGTVEMTERSEEVVAKKEARVKEEIEIHKDVEQKEKTVRDTVRKTEVDIEKTDGTTHRTTDRDRV